MLNASVHYGDCYWTHHSRLWSSVSFGATADDNYSILKADDNYSKCVLGTVRAYRALKLSRFIAAVKLRSSWRLIITVTSVNTDPPYLCLLRRYIGSLGQLCQTEIQTLNSILLALLDCRGAGCASNVHRRETDARRWFDVGTCGTCIRESHIVFVFVLMLARSLFHSFWSRIRSALFNWPSTCQHTVCF